MLRISSVAPPPGDQNCTNQDENDDDDDDRKPAALDDSASAASATDAADEDAMDISNRSDAAIQRRKDLFGDCALVEIIHLHDCLRGALHALEKDLMDLSRMVLDENASNNDDKQQYHVLLSELESRATARFQVIWSVFRAHSAAEDEFIWPALRLKTEGRIQGCGSPCYQPCGEAPQESGGGCCDGAKDDCNKSRAKKNEDEEEETVEQEEYEEDHADEERMFTMMDHLLTRLRKGLNQQKSQYQRRQQQQDSKDGSHESKSSNRVTSYNNRDTVTNTMKEIGSLVKTLNQHLMVHLEKEEKQCMPLVVKHLSKSEIHDLVGKIMGKRSSDMIAQILTMAVQNLNEADKEEMVKHMKQAMVGTFFDRWLVASGWMDGTHGKNKRAASPPTSQNAVASSKRPKSVDVSSTVEASLPKEGITSQAELEKLIRAVATNPSLDPVQKNTTIQGLRTSVWKRNQRLMGNVPATATNSGSNPPTPSRPSHSHPPSAYYQQNSEGETTLVWKALSDSNKVDDEFVPRFALSELEPTHHDRSNDGEVLGCAHYARACKLRHPLSGRLYTCRLCCEHEREAPSGDKDEPLDRYAVTEISCMKCKSLQPAAKECANQDCELHKKGFAQYYCDICHLYDDRPRPIFHCPYCNVCRSGRGLGIDYRHCMRCNACVSLADKDHRCIPQKLQGACPICHDTLFNSTEPLRGLRCGHVMHLSCFTEYRRGQKYTCPLCMRCMEDMSEYFALLDQAVRMQIMPPMYQNTFCNIYCQDCDKTGQCRYHFVGQKCSHCGSYNTREMGRFEGSMVPG